MAPSIQDNFPSTPGKVSILVTVTETIILTVNASRNEQVYINLEEPSNVLNCFSTEVE